MDSSFKVPICLNFRFYFIEEIETCQFYYSKFHSHSLVINITKITSESDPRQLQRYIVYKLNSHLTCFQRGFIAELVELRTGIAEVVDSNPVGDSEFFWVTCILAVHSDYLYHIHITH